MNIEALNVPFIHLEIQLKTNQQKRTILFIIRHNINDDQKTHKSNILLYTISRTHTKLHEPHIIPSKHAQPLKSPERHTICVIHQNHNIGKQKNGATQTVTT